MVASRVDTAALVLRLGLAALYLWFGISEVMNVAQWTSWVPAWATARTGMDVQTIVLLNGGFEIAMGALLAFGILTRWVALILALHMFLLVFDIGLTAIGVRDFAIATSTLALAILGGGRIALLPETRERPVVASMPTQ